VTVTPVRVRSFSFFKAAGKLRVSRRETGPLIDVAFQSAKHSRKEIAVDLMARRFNGGAAAINKFTRTCFRLRIERARGTYARVTYRAILTVKCVSQRGLAAAGGFNVLFSLYLFSQQPPSVTRAAIKIWKFASRNARESTARLLTLSGSTSRRYE